MLVVGDRKVRARHGFVVVSWHGNEQKQKGEEHGF